MGDEPTNDPAAPRPPDGPRPPWSSDGPAPGTPPPDAPGSTPPYASAGAPPAPPTAGAGRVPTDGDLWGERGAGIDRPSAPSSKPMSTAAKGWLGAGVGAVAIVGAALFGVNAAGSSPSAAQAGPAAYGAPDSNGQGGYGLPGGVPGDGYGLPGGGPGSGDQATRAGVGGTVASVSDASFTVNGPRGETVTVKVTDDTTITRVGEDGREEAIELADLEAGDTVTVRGEPSGDAIVASAVRVGELRGGPGMGRSGNGDCGPGMGEDSEGGQQQAPPGPSEQPPADGYGTSNQTTSAPSGSV